MEIIAIIHFVLVILAIPFFIKNIKDFNKWFYEKYGERSEKGR